MHNRLIRLSLALCAAVAAGLQPAPALAYPDSSLADIAELEQAGFRPYWTIHVPLIAGEWVREAFLVNENVYVVSSSGVVYAVEAATGLIRWAVKLTEPEFRVFKPTQYRTMSGHPVVAIVTSADINILDRYSGEVRQRMALPFPQGSTAIGYDGRLFLGSFNGRMYSLFPTTRAPRGYIELWEVSAGGPVTASPVIADHGHLVFASHSGLIASCTTIDKALHWGYRVDGAVHADLVADLDGIYVASQDRSLYKLSANSGRLEWRVRFPWELSESPTVVARTVYQYCKTQGLTAIDASTGSERWRLAEGRNLVAHSGERDYVFTDDRRLLIVDHVSGAVTTAINAFGTAFALSNTDDDAMYLFGTSGEVLCVRPDGVPYLRRQQILAARKQLNQPPEAAVAEPAPGPSTSTSVVDDADPFRSRWDRKKN